MKPEGGTLTIDSIFDAIMKTDDLLEDSENYCIFSREFSKILDKTFLYLNKKDGFLIEFQYIDKDKESDYFVVSKERFKRSGRNNYYSTSKIHDDYEKTIELEEKEIIIIIKYFYVLQRNDGEKLTSEILLGNFIVEDTSNLCSLTVDEDDVYCDLDNFHKVNKKSLELINSDCSTIYKKWDLFN